MPINASAYHSNDCHYECQLLKRFSLSILDREWTGTGERKWSCAMISRFNLSSWLHLLTEVGNIKFNWNQWNQPSRSQLMTCIGNTLSHFSSAPLPLPLHTETHLWRELDFLSYTHYSTNFLRYGTRLKLTRCTNCDAIYLEDLMYRWYFLLPSILYVCWYWQDLKVNYDALRQTTCS